MTPHLPPATSGPSPSGPGPEARAGGVAPDGWVPDGWAPGNAPAPPVVAAPAAKAAFGFPLTVLGAIVLLGAVLGPRAVVTGAGIALEVLFCAYFVRHLSFAATALRAAPDDVATPPVDTGFRPTVSVLVACHNEEAVAERLVGALVALDYPRDRLEWFVVDDGSTDRTGEILDAVAPAEPGFHVLHRPAGAGGGKSGALNAALDQATGDVIVIFDADHRPHTDVLLRLVRHFEDPQVAAVQGRCQIANLDDSPLATLVGVDYMAGYFVNEYGRQAVSRLPAYGGANCAVRASELRRLGGWNPHSVTEDTDLTLRLVLAGSRVRYDVTAVDDEEGVLTFDRYWSQRERWARGHQQAWRDYRHAVWTSRRLTFWEKVETTMFLFAFHLPVVSTFGIVLLVAWFAGYGPPTDPVALAVYSTFLFLGPMVELGAGLLLARADRRLAISLVWFLPMFLISMAVCTWAWLQWAVGRSYSWAKTKRAGDPFELADGRAAVGASATGGAGAPGTGPSNVGRTEVTA